MKTLYKITVLFLFIAPLAHSQNKLNIEMEEKHTVYKESFTTDANTTLFLDLGSSAVRFYKSKDDQVHINYTMEFNNYRKKIVQRWLDRASYTGEKVNNKITFSTKSRNSNVYREYRVEDYLTRKLERTKDTITINKSVSRKSLDSINKEIKNSWRRRLRGLGGSRSELSEAQRKKLVKRTKLMITTIDIHIPENIFVRANLEFASVYFFDTINNPVIINAQNSTLKFKSLGNKVNSFDINKGYFHAENLTAGTYNFINTKEVQIGSLSNSTIDSEFTDIEIGEIGRNVVLQDFTSSLWIYNFSKEFSTFKLDTEYSKINLFYPQQDDFYLETYGKNTIHIHNNVVATSGSVNSKKASKMLTKGNANSANKIKINTSHGIIRLSNDTISYQE
jgi:hypothetical protein